MFKILYFLIKRVLVKNICLNLYKKHYYIDNVYESSHRRDLNGNSRASIS